GRVARILRRFGTAERPDGIEHSSRRESAARRRRFRRPVVVVHGVGRYDRAGQQGAGVLVGVAVRSRNRQRLAALFGRRAAGADSLVGLPRAKGVENMLLIVGALVVIGSVVGGYLMEGGKILLLSQPAEFLIICGSGIGSLLISTPPSVVGKLVKQIQALFGTGVTRADYTDLLSMMYQLFRVIQQTGVMALEPHFENPAESPILSKYPTFMKRHTSLAFLGDSVKVIIVGGMSPHDLEALMDEDLEVYHADHARPAQTLSRLGDALPGLGIVAAV